MKQPIFALIDCNNFFVSCERLFRPDLATKPVVVLSSNDGCVIARSNEAKALGIAMATPVFTFLHTLIHHDVVQFSANFELYGDISSRITDLLTSITPHIEVYSVDESFLDLSELEISDYTAWARAVQARILQYIGMPVSIGIASSKTLAKLAAERAKKDPQLNGVLDLITVSQARRDHYLAQTPINDVWGIGWRLTPKLRAETVHTALDLAHFSTKRASQLMGVHGRQLVAELNGTTCLPLQKFHKPQQQIMRGRQFGEDTGIFSVIEAAVASMTASAASHLRSERRLAQQAMVVLQTNRKKPGYLRRSRTVQFMVPTADTGLICAALINALADELNPHEHYHKADVMLFDLIPEQSLQVDLLGTVNPRLVDRSTARLAAVDALNARFGKNHVRYAAEELSRAWRPRYKLGSPRYTSSWDDLPIVQARAR